jgi:hypothetical protein
MTEPHTHVIPEVSYFTWRRKKYELPEREKTKRPRSRGGRLAIPSRPSSSTSQAHDDVAEVYLAEHSSHVTHLQQQMDPASSATFTNSSSRNGSSNQGESLSSTLRQQQSQQSQPRPRPHSAHSAHTSKMRIRKLQRPASAIDFVTRKSGGLSSSSSLLCIDTAKVSAAKDSTLCQQCMHEVPTADLRKHLRFGCPWRLTRCTTTGCNAIYRAKESKSHVCAPKMRFRKLLQTKQDNLDVLRTCTACGDPEVANKDWDDHVLLTCSERVIKCDECGDILRASQLATHRGRGRLPLHINDNNNNDNDADNKILQHSKSKVISVRLRRCPYRKVRVESQAIRDQWLEDDHRCALAGCDFQGTLAKVHQHTDNSCGMRVVACPNAHLGCYVTDLCAKDVDEHVQNSCQVVLERARKAARSRALGSLARFACPNECGEHFDRRHLATKHGELHCDLLHVPCPHHVRGCTEVQPMREIAVHAENCPAKKRFEAMAQASRAKYARRLVNGRVACSRFCGETFTNSATGLAFMKIHAAEKCLKRQVYCRFRDHGCKKRCKADQRDVHEQKCRFAKMQRGLVRRGKELKQEVMCPRSCGMVLKDGTRHTEAYHMESVCPRRPVTCVMCGDTMEHRRSSSNDHQCRYFSMRAEQLEQARQKVKEMAERKMQARRSVALAKRQSIAMQRKESSNYVWRS